MKRQLCIKIQMTEAQIELQTKDKGTQCPPLDKFSAVGLDDSFVTEPDQEDTDFCYSQEDTTTE